MKLVKFNYICPMLGSVKNKVSGFGKKSEFVRFIIVGIAATVINYGVYYILLKAGTRYNISYTAGFAASFLFNFTASNIFTFRTRPTIVGGLKFGVSHFVNYLICIGLLNVFVYLGIDKFIAPLAVVPIAVPINFMLVRLSLKGIARSEKCVKN